MVEHCGRLGCAAQNLRVATDFVPALGAKSGAPAEVLSCHHLVNYLSDDQK